MSILKVILQTTLLWSFSASGTIDSKLVLASSQSTLQGASNSQTPELAEATQLTSSVVNLHNEGKYSEALPLAKRAVQLREKALGTANPLTRIALINLAEVYIALRKLDDAEPLFERVAKSYQKTNPGDAEMAKVLDRMALVQYAKGNRTKTEDFYRQSLEIREKAFGSDDSRTAPSIFNLAEFYQFGGNYKKSEPFYRRLISIREKALGSAHDKQLSEALGRYACLLRKTNKHAEAQELEERAFGLPPQWSRMQGNPEDAGVEGNVLNGKALSLPVPAYPEEARAARASGTVTVRVMIDETGNVFRACAVSGPPLLVRESEKAAHRAKFTPTMLSGMPVKVTGIIKYNYVAR